MRTFTKPPDAGPGDYIPYPAGTSIATLTGLFFVGRQPVTFQGESRIRPTVVLAWEGADRAADGRALSVLETLTDSLNEKSTFFNRILALTGGQEPPRVWPCARCWANRRSSPCGRSPPPLGALTPGWFPVDPCPGA